MQKAKKQLLPATFAFQYTDESGPVKVFTGLNHAENIFDIICVGVEDTISYTIACDENSTLEETCADAIATLRKQLCTLH
jgi:hypothetical protein